MTLVAYGLNQLKYRVTDADNPTLCTAVTEEFHIFLTVHLRIILVGNQLDTQFLL